MTPLEQARRVIGIEADALRDLAARLDDRFSNAVERISSRPGRVVVIGMGKTGLIGRKISATLSSMGTPSFWLHSAEAVHGDLGQVTGQDIALILSNSGETDETKRLLPLLRKLGCPVIAMTGNPASSLARHSDLVLDVSVREEGCPLGLAPMASATAALALGDALAAALAEHRGFQREDFAFFHPAGSLGRRLLLQVRDVMRPRDQIPCARPEDRVRDVLLAITRHRCGSACILDEQDSLVGIFTDGDLRRRLGSGDPVLDLPAREVMTPNPTCILESQLAAAASRVLQERRIDELPVLNDRNQLTGLLDVQDLLRAGIV